MKHSLHWFTDGRRDEGEPLVASYLLRGAVFFDHLWVECADGTTMTAEQFADDGVRWWQAFERRDPRTSSQAQRAAHDGAPRRKQD